VRGVGSLGLNCDAVRGSGPYTKVILSLKLPNGVEKLGTNTPWAVVLTGIDLRGKQSPGALSWKSQGSGEPARQDLKSLEGDKPGSEEGETRTSSSDRRDSKTAGIRLVKKKNNSGARGNC